MSLYELIRNISTRRISVEIEGSAWGSIASQDWR